MHDEIVEPSRCGERRARWPPRSLTSRDCTACRSGRRRALLTVPATRTIRGIPTEILLDERDGMPVRCVLTVDNVTTVDQAHLTRRVTTLSASRLDEVCDALAFALDC
ncbi:MAG: type II toxin-antitoxin system PemK/MazF family toxin [Ilumatobacteraceae bacterium]